MTRSLIRLTGPDTRSFLQGLVTNDVERLAAGAVYAALLTPQGKYLADFFLYPDGDTDVLLDVDGAQAPGLMQRLSMYKLRADVSLSEEPAVFLHRGFGPTPEDGWADPRHPDLGWRAWRSTRPQDTETDWDALRIANLVPAAGQELGPDSFILEHNFEALNGVDFRKGCYVGQEVTARMKHKTELRKGLARVRVDGTATPGTDIQSGGKTVGSLHTCAGNHAIAYLRFDRAGGDMTAGAAKVTLDPKPD